MWSVLSPIGVAVMFSSGLFVALLVVVQQFVKHMRALLLKRFQYFKRDLKGFLFLVFIPIAVVLAIVGLLSVRRVDDGYDSRFGALI
jgi:hypothetical protein